MQPGGEDHGADVHADDRQHHAGNALMQIFRARGRHCCGGPARRGDEQGHRQQRDNGQRTRGVVACVAFGPPADETAQVARDRGGALYEAGEASVPRSEQAPQTRNATRPTIV